MTRAMRNLLIAALAIVLHGHLANAQTTAPALTLADAQRMIAVARQKAFDANVLIAIVVVDARGDLIAAERMPGTNPPVTDIALGKATVSAIFGQPSAEVAISQFGPNPGCGPIFCDPPPPLFGFFNDLVGGKFRFIRGAVPIVRYNTVIGAISTGGAGPLDPVFAVAALAAAPK